MVLKAVDLDVDYGFERRSESTVWGWVVYVDQTLWVDLGHRGSPAS